MDCKTLRFPNRKDFKKEERGGKKRIELNKIQVKMTKPNIPQTEKERFSEDNQPRREPIQLSEHAEALKFNMAQRKKRWDMKTNLAKEKIREQRPQNCEETSETTGTSSQDQWTALLSEKDKNKALKEELKKAKNSHKELNTKYEADILVVKQEAERLRQELEKVVNSNKDKVVEDPSAEKEAVQQKMVQEIKLLKENSEATETNLQTELNNIKVSYQKLSSKYETDVVVLSKQAKTFEQQLEKEVKAHAQTMRKDQEIINNLRAELDALQQRMAQETESLQDDTKKTDHIMLAYEELKIKNDADVLALNKQVETYQQQLEKEVEAHAQTVKNDQQLINDLRAEQDALRQQMAEITRLQQTSRDKETYLNEELNKMKHSNQELCKKHEADIAALKYHTETFKQQLDREINAHTQTSVNDQQMINNLRAEQGALRQQMTREIVFQQQVSKRMEVQLHTELNQVKISYQDLRVKYESDVVALSQQVETFKQQLDNEINAHAQTSTNSKQIINGLRTEQDALRQQMEQDMALLKQSSIETAQYSFQRLYQDLIIKYETDVAALRQLLDNETNSHAQTIRNGQQIIHQLRAEHDTMVQEINAQRQISYLRQTQFQA